MGISHRKRRNSCSMHTCINLRSGAKEMKASTCQDSCTVVKPKTQLYVYSVGYLSSKAMIPNSAPEFYQTFSTKSLSNPRGNNC
jgi:hypothetical protein